jgi:hypothetical protein
MVVTGTALAGNVGTNDIADSAITTEKIAAGAVVEADIANNAVTTSKIASGVVTQAHLHSTVSAVTICTSSTRPASPFTGQMIFETDTNKHRVWLGNAWSLGTTHNAIDGLTESTAAPSASWLVQNLSVTTSGYYWIQPTGFATARQVWCDMTNSGGGWMLMGFTGTDNSTGSHVTDSYSGSAFNMGSTATSINSTSQSSGTAGNLGQSFINQLVTNGRSNGVALFRVDNTNWYFTVNSTASWLPVDSRRTVASANRTLTGNDWLKTCYTGYSTGNAGTVSGTSYAAGSAYWNTYPGNFDTHASNWGYSIDPYYNGNNGNAWATGDGWRSCHSSGWNKAGSFWLKVGA